MSLCWFVIHKPNSGITKSRIGTWFTSITVTRWDYELHLTSYLMSYTTWIFSTSNLKFFVCSWLLDLVIIVYLNNFINLFNFIWHIFMFFNYFFNSVQRLLGFCISDMFVLKIKFHIALYCFSIFYSFASTLRVCLILLPSVEIWSILSRILPSNIAWCARIEWRLS